MRAYSIDLRAKIVESVKKGVPKGETARRFGVHRATVKRYCKQLDERGTLQPRKAPGKAPKLDEKAMKLLLEDLEERPWAPPPTPRGPSSCSPWWGGEGERSDGLPGGGTPLSEPKKRSGAAAERDEFLRRLWRKEIDAVDPGRLVFVDEMGTHTSLAPLYAYAPVGERAFFEIPRNRGTNTTPVASLRQEGMGPSMAVEGATIREVFGAYVEHFLAPVLEPGQVVVMDNLGAHRPKRVRELIEARGCELLCTCRPTPPRTSTR